MTVAVAPISVAAMLVVGCSGGTPRGEPIRATNHVDAAMPVVDAMPDARVDAGPTTLLPADAATGQGRIVVTTSDECGLILDTIFFLEGSSAIRKESKPILDANAEMLACLVAKHEISLFEVQGHADAKEKDPQRLSDERALNVANAMATHGIPATAMKPVGYGNTLPMDKRNTAAARAKNRRVQILILERPNDD
jgi:outer membrane protein OmpA-like peptidoglycan-associated protein